MATQSIGVRIALEGAGDYVRDLKSATQETKALKSELELASRLENPFERASTMKGVLTSEITAQKEKIQLLTDAYNEAEESTGKFSDKTLKARDALDKAEIALDSMNRQLRDLPNGLEMAGDDLLKSADKYTKAGSEFQQAARPFWGATGVVAAGLAAVAKTSIDFEQQMAAVSAVTNASEEDMAALTATARELGATTKYTATQAGEAFEYLGRAGFNAQESIAMADSVLALAAADAIEFGEAADVSANMMHIFNLATGDMAETQANAARVADTLAQASRSANTDVLTIAETAKYAAPSFAALGWTIEDMAFAIDLAADYGVKGSQAGTGLRQAFKNLEAPTEKISLAMEKYGITLDDGTGKAVSFTAFMDDLRGVFSDLKIDVFDTSGELKEGEAIMEEYGQSLPITQMEKLQAIADIFGTRAMPTVLAMIEAGSEKYEELGSKIYNANGAAKEMQETMIDTAQGDITILISELQELALTFGELILPVLRDGLEVLKDVVARLNKMDEGTRKMILTAGLTVAAIGPVLSGIGGIISGIGGIMSVGGHLMKGTGQVIKLMTGTGGMASSLATVTAGMGTTTTAAGALAGAKGIGGIIATAGPYALAAAAIVGAGVAIYKNWDSLKEAAKVTGEEIVYFAGKAKDWLVGAFQKAGEAATELGKSIVGCARDLKDYALNAFTELGKGIVNSLATVGKSAISAFDNATGVIKNNVNNAKKWGSDLAKNLASGIQSGIGLVKSAAGKVASTIKSLLGHSTPDAGPLRNDDQWMAHMMKNFEGGILDNVGLLKNAALKASDVIRSTMTNYSWLPQAAYIDLPEYGGNYQTNMGGVQIVINQQPGQDANELAEILEEKLVALEQRRMYAYGTA